jgi:hypothetical protein
MLQPQLNRVLSDVRGGRIVDDTARDGAVHYSLLLARAQGDGRWLDYALDLVTAMAYVPGGALADELARTLESSDSVDDGRLATYVATIESRHDVRAAHWARGLRGLTARKSR